MASGDYVVGRDVDFHIGGRESGLPSTSAAIDPGTSKKKIKKRSKKKKTQTGTDSDAGYTGTGTSSGDDTDVYDRTRISQSNKNSKSTANEALDISPQMHRLKSIQESQGKKSSKKKPFTFSKKEIDSFKTSMSEERDRMLKFWRSLTITERRALATIEKDELIGFVCKERRDCACDACGNKQEAFESHLDELYNMNEALFDKFAEEMIEKDDFFFSNSPKSSAEITRTGLTGVDLLTLRFQVPQYQHEDGDNEAHQNDIFGKHDAPFDKQSHRDDALDTASPEEPPSAEGHLAESVLANSGEFASPLQVFQSLLQQQATNDLETPNSSLSTRDKEKYSRIWEVLSSIRVDQKTRTLLEAHISDLRSAAPGKDNGDNILRSLDKSLKAANSISVSKRPSPNQDINDHDITEINKLADNVAKYLPFALPNIHEDRIKCLKQAHRPVGSTETKDLSVMLNSFGASRAPLNDKDIKAIVDKIISILGFSSQSEDSLFQFFTTSLEPLFTNSGIGENDRFKVFSSLMGAEAIQKHSKVFSSIVLRLTDDLMENNGEEMISILENIQQQAPSPAINASGNALPTLVPMSPGPKTRSERDVMEFYDKMKSQLYGERLDPLKFDVTVNISNPPNDQADAGETFLPEDTLELEEPRYYEKSDLFNSVVKKCFTENDSDVVVKNAFEQLNQNLNPADVDPMDGTDNLSLRPHDNTFVANDKRRLFKASWHLHDFYGNLFEQKVMKLYREHLARERQQLLLAELAEEEERAQLEALRKTREKDKKKSKKLLAKQQREEEAQRKALEEKKKQEATRDKEEAHRAQQLESDRAKQEAHRRKIEKRMAQLALGGNATSTIQTSLTSSDSASSNPSSKATIDKPKELDQKGDDKPKNDKAPEKTKQDSSKKSTIQTDKEREKDRLKERQERLKLEKQEKLKQEKLKQEKLRAKNETAKVKAEKVATKHKDGTGKSSANTILSTPNAVHAIPFRPSSAGTKVSPTLSTDSENIHSPRSSSAAHQFKASSQPNQWHVSDSVAFSATGGATAHGQSGGGTGVNIPLSTQTLGAAHTSGAAMPPGGFGNSQVPVSLDSGLSSNLGPRISNGLGPNVPTFNSGFGGNFGPRVESPVNVSNMSSSFIGSNGTISATPSTSGNTSTGTGIPPPGLLPRKPSGQLAMPTNANIGIVPNLNNIGSHAGSTINTNRLGGLDQQFAGSFHLPPTPQQPLAAYPIMSSLWSAPTLSTSGVNTAAGVSSWGLSPWNENRKSDNSTPPIATPAPAVNKSPWGSTTQRASDADISDAACKGYEKVKHLGVDGLIPSQVLFHAVKGESSQKFTQEELYRACSKISTFHCVRDDVGLITHIKM